MQGIKYINFVEIGAMVFKIREAEIGVVLVRVNNTLLFRASFLAARHTTVCLDKKKKKKKKKKMEKMGYLAND